MNKQHITKDVFLERLNEKYSEKITYVDTYFDYYDKNQRFNCKDGVRYMVYCFTGNKGVRLHIGTFKTLIDAENAYLKAKYEGIVRLCERYDTDLSLETKNAILKHAKRKTLDKVSASAL